MTTKTNRALQWQGTMTGRLSAQKRFTAAMRIEDQEILFTTLLLWLGPPPRGGGPCKTEPNDMGFQSYVYDYSSWAQLAKDHMRQLGHNPHQGLFTEFVHWFETQWEKRDETL